MKEAIMEDDNINTKTKVLKASLWFLFIIVFLCAIYFFLRMMQGDIKTSGNYREGITSVSLSCFGKNIPYKFFSKDDPANTEVKINAIFSEDRLDSISLIHRTTYDDTATAKRMSDAHEGWMNISLQNKGMYPYSLGATYSLDNNIAQMLLNASVSELNETTIKYFMLESVPQDLSEYKQNYETLGLACKTNN